VHIDSPFAGRRSAPIIPSRQNVAHTYLCIYLYYYTTKAEQKTEKQKAEKQKSRKAKKTP